MLKVTACAQKYAWGRKENEGSEVAALHAAAGNPVEPSQPYAELWMGTHPSGPSLVLGDGRPLLEWLAAHPEALGPIVLQRFGPDLPFLFKVLSVDTALSIQAHPDKPLAQRLHRERPDVYKDPNHKPEMALAIQDFEALCGFVTTDELRTALKCVPELGGCIGAEAVSAVVRAATPEDESAALRVAFSALMTCDAGVAASAVAQLIDRLLEASKTRSLELKETLAIRLHRQYPGDVGVLSIFFLNFLQLPAGAALYLAANEPHAYVSGQLVEVMATSDNVVRAGLTPKLRDTETLCAMLTYRQGAPDVLRGASLTDQPGIVQRRYRAPFDEFQADRWAAGAGAAFQPQTNGGPGLLLITKGEVTLRAAGSAVVGVVGVHAELQVKRGDVVFVTAGAQLTVEAPVGGEGFEAYYASCADRVFESVVNQA